VTLRHVVEAGASASDSCKEQDNGEETDPCSSGESRSDRKRKRKRALVEEQDEEERNMLKESMSGLQEQRKEMREFMETFNKTQEQQVHTMNALVGALTTFLQNSKNKIVYISVSFCFGNRHFSKAVTLHFIYNKCLNCFNTIYFVKTRKII